MLSTGKVIGKLALGSLVAALLGCADTVAITSVREHCWSLDKSRDLIFVGQKKDPTAFDEFLRSKIIEALDSNGFTCCRDSLGDYVLGFDFESKTVSQMHFGVVNPSSQPAPANIEKPPVPGNNPESENLLDETQLGIKYETDVLGLHLFRARDLDSSHSEVWTSFCSFNQDPNRDSRQKFRILSACIKRVGEDFNGKARVPQWNLPSPL